ncbi:hypothetical protein RCL1_005946 [Eukaryota sp. TZLM3-RCL]
MTFLRSGQQFRGIQLPSSGAYSPWDIELTIRVANLDEGFFSGVLKASNIPNSRSHVSTLFTAQIVDGIRSSFLTVGENCDPATDLIYWSKFQRFQNLFPQILDRGLLMRNSEQLSEILQNSQSIYFRLKERAFLELDREVDLTIAGFYFAEYVKGSGTIQAMYHDPKARPGQTMKLSPVVQSFQEVSFL